MSDDALNTDDFINSRGISRFQLAVGALGVLVLVADDLHTLARPKCLYVCLAGRSVRCRPGSLSDW